MAIYLVLHFVVVDTTQIQIIDSTNGYVAIAERPEKSVMFGYPIPVVNVHNALNNIEIPEEIARNPESLRLHLALITGEEWTVFSDRIVTKEKSDDVSG